MRLIRSFVRRERRITRHQAQAYERLLPKYGLRVEQGLLNWDQLFSKPVPPSLEIGFGMGENLLRQALTYPEQNYLGVEVYRPGVGALLAQIESHQLSNLKVFCADAIDVLTYCLPPQCLSQIQIFFPDPWPKKRHHKRRLMQESFVYLLKNKLMPGGRLYFATDWENYAQHTLFLLERLEGWKNTAGSYQFAPRPPERVITRFEKRGQLLGNAVRDLVFMRL